MVTTTSVLESILTTIDGKGGAHYDFDRAIPRARAKGVFGHEIPMDGKHLALVLLPGLHGEVVQSDVEELNGAIADGDDDLVLVGFRPGEVVQGILSIEPQHMVSGNGREGACTDVTHHFSGRIPWGVRPKMYNRPLPTKPKLAAEATAMRESKKGEYLTA